MHALVLDTSIWVEWLRGRKTEEKERVRGRILFLPSVVEMELLSGVRDRKSARLVEKIVSPFARNRRIVVPSAEDYRLAGEILSELGLSASRLGSDVLIAVCAKKVGAELWTDNFKDFKPIAKALGLKLYQVRH